MSCCGKRALEEDVALQMEEMEDTIARQKDSWREVKEGHVTYFYNETPNLCVAQRLLYRARLHITKNTVYICRARSGAIVGHDHSDFFFCGELPELVTSRMAVPASFTLCAPPLLENVHVDGRPVPARQAMQVVCPTCGQMSLMDPNVGRMRRCYFCPTTLEFVPTTPDIKLNMPVVKSLTRGFIKKEVLEEIDVYDEWQTFTAGSKTVLVGQAPSLLTCQDLLLRNVAKDLPNTVYIVQAHSANKPVIGHDGSTFFHIGVLPEVTSDQMGYPARIDVCPPPVLPGVIINGEPVATSQSMEVWCQCGARSVMDPTHARPRRCYACNITFQFVVAQPTQQDGDQPQPQQEPAETAGDTDGAASAPATQ